MWKNISNFVFIRALANFCKIIPSSWSTGVGLILLGRPNITLSTGVFSSWWGENNSTLSKPLESTVDFGLQYNKMCCEISMQKRWNASCIERGNTTGRCKNYLELGLSINSNDATAKNLSHRFSFLVTVQEYAVLHTVASLQLAWCSAGVDLLLWRSCLT